MSKTHALDALAPFTAQLLEEIIADDYAGEQAAPPQQLPNPIFELQGQTQLVAIAQIDPALALKLKWLLDSIEEANFEDALHALDHVAFSVRSLRLDSRADESGVVQ